MLNIEPWSIVFILVNLLILYIIMRKVFVNPIKNVIEKRNSIIQDGLDNAAKSEQTAKDLEKEWGERLASARGESAKMVEKAKADARTEYDKIVEDANSEAKRIIDNAHATTEQERQKAMDDIRKEIAGIAIEATRKVLGNADMAAVTDSLYEDFLTETGD